jgi:integrase/recombinase XerD
MGKVLMTDLVLIRPESATAEEEHTALVLHGVTSPHSRRAYATGLAQFFTWLKGRRPQTFSKVLVQEYRSWLLEQGLSSSAINLRLSPLRKLAREMSDNGLLDPGLASGIERTRGVKQQGSRELAGEGTGQ